MTLRTRLLVFLVGGFALAWIGALAISVPAARHEVNELFDTGLIRLARQAQSLLNGAAVNGSAAEERSPPAGANAGGEADMDDLAIAAWDRHGRVRFTDREGTALPWREGRAGFVDLALDGQAWRVYYLQSFDGDLLVAAGQRVRERDEMVLGLVVSELLPWLIVLPMLMLALAFGIRGALSPLQRLVADVGNRGAQDLEPIDVGGVPGDLLPLVDAVNALFGRIANAMTRERAFTEDAAHELRTPLAVLRAQWDVLRRAVPGPEREIAVERLGAGLQRMERLVTQMLALARLESSALALQWRPVHWPRIIEDVFSDCLPLAEARAIELACEWPAGNDAAIALHGDSELVRVMLRNLLDNAVRYAPPGSSVTVRVLADRIEVENETEARPDDLLSRLGERFYRPKGQAGIGSGLGVSIVGRIAALHGLEAAWTPRRSHDGIVVTLRRSAAISARAPSEATSALPRAARCPPPAAPDAAAPRAHARET